MTNTATASISLDTSQAVQGASALMGAFQNISSSGLAMFAAVEAAGSGLEHLGQSLLGAVGSAVSAATQIQSAQAQLTTQSYNFGESLGQNQAQSAAMTKQLVSMATSIKQPIAGIQQLAAVIAGTGNYSSSALPLMTKEFAEFGAVTGSSATQAVKYITQIAEQTHTSASEMGNLMSAIYATGKETAGGTANLLSMTDRMAGLSLVTGMTAQQFVALAATSSDFDARLRGGAYGALQHFSSLLDASVGGKQTEQTQAFFKFMGDGSVEAGKKIVQTQGAFENFQMFLNKLGQQGGPESAVKGVTTGAFNTLSNLGLASQNESNIAQGFAELASNQRGPKGMGTYLDTANQAWQSGTDVQTAYQAVQATTASQMIGLKDTVTQLANTIGTDLLPAVNTGAHLLQDFTGVVSLIPAPILSTVAALTALTGGLLVGAGAVTRIGGVIKGLPGRGGTKTKADTAEVGNAAAVTEDTAATGENTAAKEANTEVVITNTAAIEENAAALSFEEAEIAAAAAELDAIQLAFQSSTAATSENTIATEANAASKAASAEANAGFMASLGGISGVAAGAAGGLAIIGTAALGLGAYFHAASQGGKNAADSLKKNWDVSSVQGIFLASQQAQSQADQAKKKGAAGSWLGAVGQEFEHMGDTGVAGASMHRGASVKENESNIKDLKTTMDAATAVAQNFWETATPSNDQLNQVLSMASKNMVDLAHGGAQAQQSLAALLTTQETENQATQKSDNQAQLDALGQAAMDAAQQQHTLDMSTDELRAAQLAASEAAQQNAHAQDFLANAENQVAEAQLNVQSATLNTQQAEMAQAAASYQLQHAADALASAQAKVSEANLQQRSATLSLLEAQITAGSAQQEQNLKLQSSTLSYAQSQTQAVAASDNLRAAQWNLYKIGADYALQYQSALNRVADSTLSLQQVQISAQNAQWQLTYLQQEGASQRDIQMAQLNLAQANQQVIDTTTQAGEAQQTLQQLPTDHSIQLASAQDQLASSQQSVTQSSISEQQALIALHKTQQETANNLGVQQAQIALGQAQDKVAESAWQVVQAQTQLNELQSGSLQLAYNSATLQVQAANLKEHDAAFQVIQAQIQLNTLQNGSIQLQFKRAQDQVTQAQWAQGQATVALKNDQAILAGGLNTTYQQAQILANTLMASSNPQIHQLGVQLMNSIPALQGAYNNVVYLNDPVYKLGLSFGETAIQAGNLADQVNAATAAAIAYDNQNAAAMQTAAGTAGAVHFAAGGIVTKPTLAIVGEKADEVILPLNDMERSKQLLVQAGIVDSYGMPSVGYAGGITAPATSVSSAGSSKTVNQTFNLQAITQPADPQEIINEFAWQQRLVGVP